MLAADDAAKPREESMRSDRFADAHAPLFQPPKSKDAGALTRRSPDRCPNPAAAPLDVAVHNFIDKFIFGKMQRDRMPHAPLATDHEFLRRVSLDLTGRIPSSR